MKNRLGEDFDITELSTHLEAGPTVICRSLLAWGRSDGRKEPLRRESAARLLVARGGQPRSEKVELRHWAQMSKNGVVQVTTSQLSPKQTTLGRLAQSAADLEIKVVRYCHELLQFHVFRRSRLAHTPRHNGHQNGTRVVETAVARIATRLTPACSTLRMRCLANTDTRSDSTLPPSHPHC